MKAPPLPPEQPAAPSESPKKRYATGRRHIITVVSALLADSIIAELEAHDPDVARAVASEADRQHATIELIASENHASPAVTLNKSLRVKFSATTSWFAGAISRLPSRSMPCSRRSLRTAPSRSWKPSARRN